MPDDPARPAMFPGVTGPLVDGQGAVDRLAFVAAFGDDPLVLPDIEVVGLVPSDTARFVRALRAGSIHFVERPDGEPIAIRPADGLLVNCWAEPTLMLDFDLREVRSDESGADERFAALLVFLRWTAGVLRKPVQVMPEGGGAPVLVVRPPGGTG